MTCKPVSSLAWIAAIALLTSSCSTVPVITIMPYPYPVRTCTLATVQLESLFSYSQNQRELRSLIIAIGKDHGFSIYDQDHPPVLAGSCSISFFLREKTLTNGLATTRSSSILAEIANSNGELLYQASWIRDSTDTLESMKHLRKALHTLFRSLKHKALHPHPF